MGRACAHRRGIMAAGVALAVVASGAARAQLVPPFMSFQQTEKLADGLYAFRQGAYRSIFLVSDAGVIVTDPVSAKFAEAMRAEIRKVTDQPVKYVAYSHSHRDRIGGGLIFKAEGARFVAQERCAENLRETPNPQVIAPDLTYRDEYTIRLGDKALELHYFGPSLDDCLSVFVAKPANMMMVVNIAGPPTGNLPWNPTVPDYRLWNIVPFFRAAEDLARRDGIQTLIGGFIAVGNGPDGKPFLQPSTGPVSALADQRLFWEKLMGAVKGQLDAGTPAREVIHKLDLKPFMQYQRYNERSMAILVRRVASLYIIGR